MKKIYWVGIVVVSFLIGISVFYLVNNFVRGRVEHKVIETLPEENKMEESDAVIIEPPIQLAVAVEDDSEYEDKKIAEEDTEEYEYIVGVLDGYITVFYREEVEGTNVKEITESPASALSKDEQVNLRQGIKIRNEMELMRVLEDYGS